MKKIYYHVVTEKPMELGQEIVFDENHHSGVYDRVYAFKDKVEEIYNNPKEYENVELDHHLKVAFRELALEEVRKKKYPEYPSRLASLYVSNSLDGNVYVGDSWNCFEGTIDKKKNLELAENYWKYEKNNIGKEPIVEVLVNGKIKVIEIVKENENTGVKPFIK